ncbi:MAG: hypothetical protein O2U61_05385 [Candidatus Bathyarchaeota archaeon]|nr:hypothetical protein [Candidatus Bathyarchaeota archaeon]
MKEKIKALEKIVDDGIAYYNKMIDPEYRMCAIKALNELIKINPKKKDDYEGDKKIIIRFKTKR